MTTSKTVIDFAKKESNVHHRLNKFKNNLLEVEEKEIRNNPKARTSALLLKVFK